MKAKKLYTCCRGFR